MRDGCDGGDPAPQSIAHTASGRRCARRPARDRRHAVFPPRVYGPRTQIVWERQGARGHGLHLYLRSRIEGKRCAQLFAIVRLHGFFGWYRIALTFVAPPRGRLVARGYHPPGSYGTATTRPEVRRAAGRIVAGFFIRACMGVLPQRRSCLFASPGRRPSWRRRARQAPIPLRIGPASVVTPLTVCDGRM
jgi:hypothetical protein